MAANHPNFQFAWAKSVFYNFRRVHEDGLCDCIFLSKRWKGWRFGGRGCHDLQSTLEWGRNVPYRSQYRSSVLKFGRTNWIEAELNWYIYRNSKSELNLVFAEISGDLRLHAMDFFAKSAKSLRSDELLQYGLSLVAEWEPPRRVASFTSLRNGTRRRAIQQNPLYRDLESALHQFATDGGHATDKIRSYVNRLLYNFTRPGWSWKNSRI